MELLRALGALAEAPAPEHARLARLLGLPAAPDPADHTGLFVLQLYPYASVYLGAEGMLGGEARDRIAGFWRALGLAPPPEPDHLAALLGFHAALAERDEGAGTESGAPWRHARAAFFHEHLASWLGPYLARVEELAPPVYRAWGALLRDALAAEAETLYGADAPAALPLHLREAPAFPAPAESGLDELISAVLAPVRSGVVLARADLARAAEETGLGLRMGERRYALRHLMEQDADVTLRWLAGECRRQSALDRGAAAPAIEAFWSARAHATASALTPHP